MKTNSCAHESLEGLDYLEDAFQDLADCSNPGFKGTMAELRCKAMAAAEVVKCVKQEILLIQMYMDLQQTHLLDGKADVEECLDHIARHAEFMKRPSAPSNSPSSSSASGPVPDSWQSGCGRGKRPRADDDV